MNNMGENKATIKDQNNKWFDKIIGNSDFSNINPTNILFEKSTLGKSNKPKKIPKIIDLNTFSELIFLL